MGRKQIQDLRKLNNLLFLNCRKILQLEEFNLYKVKLKIN
jgi:hypothetical protein